MFLGVIKLTNEGGKSTSTGLAQGEAVYKQVEDWNCSSKVVALVCDTTASNTGKDRGAMVRLHRLLKVPLLYLLPSPHFRVTCQKSMGGQLWKVSRTRC